ncbi:uncharacterized protein LOC142341653 isoform X2 [Convolutriloba macropyga]|uniref:uncharacterized protein LOC142341653 isoform X2 n=1 Tax=Convolutriloba macropyga TaxID=536237 RepID=UPI003F51CD4B
MVANMGVYNTGDSLAGVRGSELPRQSDTKPLSSSPESVGSGSNIPQIMPENSEANEAQADAWKKLTAGEIGKIAGNDSAEYEEFARGSGISGKSPRKLGFMPSDQGAQPPMKKECLASEKPGPTSSGSGSRGNFDGNGGGNVLPQRTPALNHQARQIPISAEALFGGASVGSPVQQQGAGSLQGTVASATGGLLNTLKSPAQTVHAQAMAQSQQLLMQLLEQQHAMQLMQIQQLHAAAAMGNHPLLSPNGYLESTTRSLAEQLNRSVTGVAANMNAAAAAGVSPKTSTPKGKMIGAPAAPAAGRLSSSSGYLTDSSYNTSAENSLHELVSKIALQGPNHGINDALSTSGTSGATGFSGDASASLDLIRDSRWTNQSYISQSSQLETSGSSYGNVDQLAENHRKSAASSEATCTWVGQLPPKNTKNPQYSCKVFLGGVPWDITESMLQSQFKQFGPVTVDWPGKEKNHGKNPPSGYVYLIFENEKAIRSLLTACTNDFTNCQNSGEYYFKLSSKRTRSKEVQVIPWAVNDSNFSRVPQGSRTETQRTVFVGALHGMLNAEALANIMNDLFGGVTFAGIDTDKYKYPIGSGRVAFNNDRSYMKAVSAGFIEIKANKFSKKVQVDPYLDDHLCSQCAQVPGQYFCREVSCFTYYCLPCWNWHHSIEAYKPHVPLTRNSKVKNNIVPPVTPVPNMPQTHFGIQYSSQSSNDAQEGSMIPTMASAFQPFATSTGGIGGCEALDLNAIMNMNSVGASNAGTGSVNVSRAGAAGLFQQNPGSNIGLTGAIEARN